MKRKLQMFWLKLFGAKGQKTNMLTLARCPQCGSFDTERRHAHGTFALPECYFQQCEDCGQQWGHS